MQFRRELSVLACLCLMEALSGFALLVGIGLVAGDPLHGSIFWLILPATIGGTLLALALAGLDDLSDRAAIAIAVLVVALCALPPVLLLRADFAGVVLTALLIGVFLWRGALITPRETDHYEVQRRFSLRLAMLLLGIIILVARGDSEDSSIWLMLSLTGIGFVAAGLAALGISRLNEAGPASESDGAGVAIATPIAGLLVLSFGALALVSVNVLAWIGGLIGPVWDFITTIVALALTALIYPLFLLLSLLHPGSNGLKLRSPFKQPPSKTPPHQSAHHALTLWSVIETVLIALAVVAVMSVILALVLRATRSVHRKEREPSLREERRTLVTAGEALRLLLAWLRGLFGRGATSAIQLAESARHRVLGPTYPTDPVRRVYAQILYRAARQGVTRSGSTTPAEFELHLQQHWPEGGREFAAVTQAYVRRRYGEESPSEADVREVREHWQRLRRVMRPPS